MRGLIVFVLALFVFSALVLAVAEVGQSLPTDLALMDKDGAL